MLGVACYLVRAVLWSGWRGFGFGGGGGFGGPVGVHAELLGQVHVEGLGHGAPSTAQPAQTPPAPEVDATLKS